MEVFRAQQTVVQMRRLGYSKLCILQPMHITAKLRGFDWSTQAQDTTSALIAERRCRLCDIVVVTCILQYVCILLHTQPLPICIERASTAPFVTVARGDHCSLSSACGH